MDNDNFPYSYAIDMPECNTLTDRMLQGEHFREIWNWLEKNIGKESDNWSYERVRDPITHELIKAKFLFAFMDDYVRFSLIHG